MGKRLRALPRVKEPRVLTARAQELDLQPESQGLSFCLEHLLVSKAIYYSQTKH